LWTDEARAVTGWMPFLSPKQQFQSAEVTNSSSISYTIDK